MEALSRQRQTDKWLKDGGQFIPNPATWLNQRRWEDQAVSAIVGVQRYEVASPDDEPELSPWEIIQARQKAQEDAENANERS